MTTSIRSGATDGALQVNGVDAVVFNANGITVGVPNQSGYKNKIIGGDFTTNPWQRGTSFAAPASGTYTADRWAYGKAGSAVQTVSKVADAPTIAQAGLFTQYCLALNVTTAQTTFAVSDFSNLEHRIEGLNSAAFGFGQTSTKPVTLSFWVKGAKTGIHCISIRNGAASRSYVVEYTILAANTWEYKTITMPVDTTGTWSYDNTAGLVISFALATGTGYQTTANSWQTGNFITTANQVNELDTVGNNFKIALVQLEAGSNATAFETRSVGLEWILALRYYEVVNFTVSPTGAFTAQVPYVVTKRAPPTLALISGSYNSATVSGQGVWGMRQDTNATGASLAVTSATAEL